VPSTSTNKQAKVLRKYKIKNPDLEWGNYSLLRPWDKAEFLKSLRDAEKIPTSELNQDGNRAIIFCSTTDPFQVFHAETVAKTRLLNESAGQLVRNCLEMIRDESTLNVRILTRSPMAREYFDLFKSFGKRLVFGMSLPTLNDKLREVYEPKAPGIQARLNTLRQAKEAGLSVFIAMAPTYPECDEDDVRKTLLALKEFDPITIYHEPINIRAENVARIASQAKQLGIKLRTNVFKDRISWWQYALNSLIQVQRLAQEVGLLHCLHLWPDKSLKTKKYFLQSRHLSRKGMRLTRIENQQQKENDLQVYEREFLPWLQGWWSRVSEWPGERPNRRLAPSKAN
jgi:DNA repair photolyase